MYVFGSGGIGGEGGEWMRGLCLGFTNPVGRRGVLEMCLCLGCGGVGDKAGEWVRGLELGLKSGVVLCLCDL